MIDADLLFKSGLELAEGVRAGEYSARELTELALARIDELNPGLNAFIMTDADRALIAFPAVLRRAPHVSVPEPDFTDDRCPGV